jgi:Fur family peroxide stress response transcriptional regulator
MISAVQKRATRQLAAVYEALQDDHSHPSADEIYQRVRRQLPRISLGTVYRDLQRLVEEGKIRVFLLGERVARYDPMLVEHDHFICQQCGRVEDIFLERDRQVNLAPLTEKGFTVTTHSLTIHGVCRKCGQGRQKKSQAKWTQGSRGRKASRKEEGHET